MKVSVLERSKGELNLPLIYMVVTATSVLPLALLYLFDRMPIYDCPFKVATGFPCPTCGMTRSFMSLINLDIQTAFLYNPLVFIVGIIFLLWGCYGFYMHIQRKKIRISLSHREGILFRIVLGMLVLLNWLYLILNGI